jgi:hypothetical protein
VKKVNFNKAGNIVNDILKNILQKNNFWEASDSYLVASQKTQGGAGI